MLGLRPFDVQLIGKFAILPRQVLFFQSSCALKFSGNLLQLLLLLLLFPDASNKNLCYSFKLRLFLVRAECHEWSKYPCFLFFKKKKNLDSCMCHTYLCASKSAFPSGDLNV